MLFDWIDLIDSCNICIDRLIGVSAIEMSRDFEEKCSDTAEEVAQRNKLRYCICVDGSDAADLAFLSVMNMRRKYDFIAVFHALSENKGDFIQPNWRPAAIQSHYECELVSRVLPTRYKIVMARRGERSFLDTLAHNVSQYEDSELIRCMGGHFPDFVVFGYAQLF
jgi:hypothetical protein